MEGCWRSSGGCRRIPDKPGLLTGNRQRQLLPGVELVGATVGLPERRHSIAVFLRGRVCGGMASSLPLPVPYHSPHDTIGAALPPDGSQYDGHEALAGKIRKGRLGGPHLGEGRESVPGLYYDGLRDGAALAAGHSATDNGPAGRPQGKYGRTVARGALGAHYGVHRAQIRVSRHGVGKAEGSMPRRSSPTDVLWWEWGVYPEGEGGAT